MLHHRRSRTAGRRALHLEPDGVERRQEHQDQHGAGRGAAGLRWRLFDFGKVDAEVGQAKGAEAEALAKYRQSVLRATVESFR